MGFWLMATLRGAGRWGFTGMGATAASAMGQPTELQFPGITRNRPLLDTNVLPPRPWPSFIAS